MLQASRLAPERLELEITESAVLGNDSLTHRILSELHAPGVGLALDDFGTGYSSLSSLRRMPVGRVKIDRSFVSDLPESADDRALVEAIIAMAHSLQIPVVAEGGRDPRAARLPAREGL